MYDKNDPVGIAVQMGAGLFAIMADEVIRSCGTREGESIVRQAVRRYAAMRAEKIKERIIKDGKEVTFKTVEEYSDYPPNKAWDCDSVIEGDTLREENRVCPFSTAFRELGLEKAGALYCEEIDITLNQIFFGDIEFSREKFFMDFPGSPCDMTVTIKK